MPACEGAAEDERVQRGDEHREPEEHGVEPAGAVGECHEHLARPTAAGSRSARRTCR
jgi:hypothetical protein